MRFVLLKGRVTEGRKSERERERNTFSCRSIVWLFGKAQHRYHQSDKL